MAGRIAARFLTGSAAPLDFFEKTGPEPCGFSIFGLTGERERGYPVKEKPPVCKRCRGGKLRFWFVVWGLLFGVLLTAEKLFLDKWLQKCGRILPHVYVMAVVVLSFVLFNASSMQGALADIAAVLGLTGAPFAGTLSLYYLKSYAVLLAVSVVGCTPWPKKLALALPEGVRAVLEPVAMAVLLLLVTAYLVDGSFNPFLYFRF